MRPDGVSGHGCSSPPSAQGRPQQTDSDVAWRKPLQGGRRWAIAIPQRSTRWNFQDMPLKTNTVEAASRTLLLLEELNRHRVTSIDRLHKATGLPKSTVVRLMKSLCAMGYAANDRRQGGYAVASRVKSLSNGFHGDPLVVEAARPWALAFTRQYHWPIAIAVLDRSSVVMRFS